MSAEGSNVSDGASQCTDSVAHSEAKHDRVDHVTPGHGGNRGGTAPLSHDDTLTETESIISSRQGHHLHKSSRHHSEKYEKYNKYNGRLAWLFASYVASPSCVFSCTISFYFLQDFV